MTSKRAPRNLDERIIRGIEFDWPLVVSVASLQSRSAARITWHQHSGFECLFWLEGMTQYEFPGGRTVGLSGGQFLIISPRLRHRGLHDLRQPSRFCSIQVTWPTSQKRIFNMFSITETGWLRSQFEQAKLASYQMNAEFRRVVNTFANEIATASFESVDRQARIRLLTAEVILATAKHVTSFSSAAASESVKAAMKIMMAKYAEDFSVDEIAKQLGLSRSRLFASFKSETGMTPKHYLQRLRVEKAAKLLKQRELSVTEIALRCGFSSSQYFNAVFRKYYRCTPTTYRES